VRGYLATLVGNLANGLERSKMVDTGVKSDLVHDGDAGINGATGVRIMGTKVAA
jgi:hypothetical protein